MSVRPVKGTETVQVTPLTIIIAHKLC